MQIIVTTQSGNTFIARWAGDANRTFGDTAAIARQRLNTGPKTFGAYQNIHLAMQGRENLDKPKHMHRKKRGEKKYVQKDSGVY
jgi:hypothetical protein